SLNILRDLLQVKTDHKISRTELSLLGQDLIDLNILPEGVDQNAVDQLIKVAVNNILNDPKNRLAGVVPDALNATSVDVVRNEAQVWLDTEYFITKLSENWSPSQGLTSGELVNVLEKGLKVPENSSFLNEGLNELLLSVKDSTPLAIDSEGRLNISNRVQQIYTKKSLKQLNIDRALSRLAIHSFAGDLDRIKNYSGVTLDEVNFGFSELKIIFVKMGLLDPTNNSFGASRFRDANLFTPHANGDSLASYQEITDLVSMIWSGLNINSKLKDELLKDCLQGVQNPNSNTAVQTDCALKSYKNSMAKYMTATPEYLRYMKWANTNDEMDGYVLNVFKTAGYVPNSKKTARWGDLSLAPHIVQYIEMVFARFDKDKDGFITTPEALMAFPLFKGLLLEFAKDQIKKGSISEKDLPAIFCFMLHYGKPPETKIEKLVFWWNWLRKSSDDWDVRAGRGDLAKILGYVADKTAKAPIPEIPDIEKDLPPEAR
ncbi:MAG TPA: hypothetical protein VN132_10425, partial [Bdellovibrio sp.]|nr:hypothetical protein [Bdellovibrio sp.]